MTIGLTRFVPYAYVVAFASFEGLRWLLRVPSETQSSSRPQKGRR